MPILSEVPTEVLRVMAKSSGIDTTGAPGESPVQTQQDERAATPSVVNSMVARLKQENGNIGELSKLLRQRVGYNKLVKQISDDNTAQQLAKQADVNRRLLNSAFLQRPGTTRYSR